MIELHRGLGGRASRPPVSALPSLFPLRSQVRGAGHLEGPERSNDSSAGRSRTAARHLEFVLRGHAAMPSLLMDYAPDYEHGRRILMEGLSR